MTEEFFVACGNQMLTCLYVFVVQGSLHVHWAMEKSSLEAAKLEAEKKVKALDEQVRK